jgi:hypothetical protein
VSEMWQKKGLTGPGGESSLSFDVNSDQRHLTTRRFRTPSHQHTTPLTLAFYREMHSEFSLFKDLMEFSLFFSRRYFFLVMLMKVCNPRDPRDKSVA